MTKLKKSIWVIIALFIIYAVTVPVSATTPVLSISGPATVRTGNTITVSVYLNGTGILSTQGVLSYNSSLLTFQSCSGTLSGWSFDTDGTTAGKVTFLGINDALNSPINSKKQILTISFKVKTGLSTGTNIKVSSQNVTVSDGNTDTAVANTSYSVNLAAPLSTNANLKSLTVSNAVISPAFSSGTTSYTATVAYDISTLSVSAAADDSGANVSVTGKDLSVGQNTVSILVTAASGATKTYTITVTREQDPNYVPGDNTNLKSIIPSVGILSPVFDPLVSEYVVYIPYEQDKISLI